MRSVTTGCRAVFLDAGGTLIHLDRDFILSRVADAGVTGAAARFDDAHRAACRRVADLIAAGGSSNDAGRWDAFRTTLLASLGCPPDAADPAAAMNDHYAAGRMWSRVEPGTTEALDALRTLGVAIGVVSNSDGRAAEALERAGLAPGIDFVIDSALVGLSKPDPRIFALACERAGVPPAQAMHVGDIAEIDVVGARGAGVRAVLFDPDDRGDRDVERVRHLGDIPALVRPSRIGRAARTPVS